MNAPSINNIPLKDFIEIQKRIENEWFILYGEYENAKQIMMLDVHNEKNSVVWGFFDQWTPTHKWTNNWLKILWSLWLFIWWWILMVISAECNLSGFLITFSIIWILIILFLFQVRGFWKTMSQVEFKFNEVQYEIENILNQFSNLSNLEKMAFIERNLYFEESINSILRSLNSIAKNISRLRWIRQNVICEDMHKKLYNWTVYITEQYMKIFNYWISLNINTLKNQGYR